MFEHSADLYDTIYAFKDYEAESTAIHQIIQRHQPGAKSLLDVACGTGQHLQRLSDHYEAQGADLDPNLLEIARRRNPGMIFHHANMVELDLGSTFDVVTCLFSSIGYARTVERLHRATERLAAHVAPGGVLLIEPWLHPEDFESGHLGMVTVDEPDLKIARVNTTHAEGNLSIVEFGYLITTREGIRHFDERHEVGLFTDDEYKDAIARAGLELEPPEDLIGRGLYVAVRSD